MSSTRFRISAALACAAVFGSAVAVHARPNPSDHKPAVAPPRLGDDAELARGTNLYESGQYKACASDFADLLDSKSPRAIHDPHIIQTARVYYATCLIGSGRPALADKPLRDAIRENPQMKPPDSTIFPRLVIDRFLRVRESMLDEIRKAERARIEKAQAKARKAEDKARLRRERIARLKELASEEEVITKSSRWLAAVPFGVGQFQNRQPVLGWTLLTTEAVLAGTAFGMIVLESHYTRQAFDPGKAAGLAQNHRTAQKVLIVSSYSLLGVTALGILQAELAFKPEFHDGVRKRKLPPSLESASASASFVPSGGPVAGGGFQIGVTGRF